MQELKNSTIYPILSTNIIKEKQFARIVEGVNGG
jgi:hypothetical protein